ncbi:MAG: H-NS histone family protein [Proteobacteria bacterium]|nr:H-NS histone family protein [Pseudomonadota bacterium]
MAIDLKGLSKAQLDDIIQRAHSRKQEMDDEKIVKAREKILGILKTEKLTLEQVFPKLGGRKRAPAKPKYRNPANALEIWSGRGKRPRWFNSALAAGKKEKDLLI